MDLFLLEAEQDLAPKLSLMKMVILSLKKQDLARVLVVYLSLPPRVDCIIVLTSVLKTMLAPVGQVLVV